MTIHLDQNSVLLKNMIELWDGNSLRGPGPSGRSITELALEILAVGRNLDVVPTLDTIREADPNDKKLTDKIEALRKILFHYPMRYTSGTYEQKFGLDVWDGGPNKKIACDRILCWIMTHSFILDLSHLELPSLPRCVVDHLILLHKEYPFTGLNCSHNKLQELPADLEVHILDCSHNQLTTLPPLHNTVTILASFNRICEFSHFHSHMVKVNLSHNKLTKLDVHYLNETGRRLPLTKLQHLDCSHNQIENLQILLHRLLPDGSLLTSGLQNLDAAHNRLFRFPKTPNNTTPDFSFNPGRLVAEIQALKAALKKHFRKTLGSVIFTAGQLSKEIPKERRDFLMNRLHTALTKSRQSVKLLSSSFDSLYTPGREFFGEDLISWISQLNLHTAFRSPSILALQTLPILSLTATTPPYQQLVAGGLEEASSTCSDRALYYLNVFTLAQKLETASTLEEKIAVVRGAYANTLLEALCKKLVLIRVPARFKTWTSLRLLLTSFIQSLLSELPEEEARLNTLSRSIIKETLTIEMIEDIDEMVRNLISVLPQNDAREAHLTTINIVLDSLRSLKFLIDLYESLSPIPELQSLVDVLCEHVSALENCSSLQEIESTLSTIDKDLDSLEPLVDNSVIDELRSLLRYEEIELYLRLQSEFQEEFQLPFEKNTMMFTYIAPLSSEEKGVLQNHMRESLSNEEKRIDYFVHCEAWIASLRQEFAAALAESLIPYALALESIDPLYEDSECTPLDPATLYPNLLSLLDTYNASPKTDKDYHDAVTAIQEERTIAELNFFRAKTRDLLSSSSH